MHTLTWTIRVPCQLTYGALDGHGSFVACKSKGKVQISQWLSNGYFFMIYQMEVNLFLHLVIYVLLYIDVKYSDNVKKCY